MLPQRVVLQRAGSMPCDDGRVEFLRAAAPIAAPGGFACLDAAATFAELNGLLTA